MLTNHTPSPALTYDGIDGADVVFGVIVCRQTYEWNDEGLLVLSEIQDPLCFADELVDDKDVMKGVLQESDLCEYKPKCDVIVLGSAYAPSGIPAEHFVAKLMVKTPDSYVFDEVIPTPKDKDMPNAHAYRQQQILNLLTKNHYTQQQGQILINKTLAFCGQQYVSKTALGDYELSAITPVDKVTLDGTKNYGGFCFVEQNHPNAGQIPKDKQLPADVAQKFTIAQATGPVLYYNQSNHNPYGTGFIDRLTLKARPETQIALPQVINSTEPFTKAVFERQIQGALDNQHQERLNVGFGIRPKTHPQRAKLVGVVDEQFTQSGELLPEGFDFAVWNAAYPDQQCDYLKGNEWIVLANLCSANTRACTIDKEGNHLLKLYLPENTIVAYVEYEDKEPSEIPLHIDTLVIRPDDGKVNIVWRTTLDKVNHMPTSIHLVMLDRKAKDDAIARHFSQKGAIIRPYKENGI